MQDLLRIVSMVASKAVGGYLDAVPDRGKALLRRREAVLVVEAG
jgi:hypothetical protein